VNAEIFDKFFYASVLIALVYLLYKIRQDDKEHDRMNKRAKEEQR